MPEVIKISDRTWRIEEEGVRYFLLEGRDRALLVDSGMRSADARQIAGSVTALPLSLFTTHADPDHISGCAAFDRMYIHPLEEPSLRAKGYTGTIDPVADGDVIDLGGRALQVIALQGHTPGHTALLDREARFLIGGDAIQNGRIFMFGPGRDLPGYIDSLEQLLKNHSGAFDTVFPSHGDFPQSPKIIEALIASARMIRNDEAEGKPVSLFGREVMLYQFPCAGFLRPMK